MEKMLDFLIFLGAILLFSSCGETHEEQNTPFFRASCKAGDECNKDILASLDIDGMSEHATYPIKAVCIDTVKNVKLYNISFKDVVVTQAFENERLELEGITYPLNVELKLRKGTFTYSYEGYPNMTVPKKEGQRGSFKVYCP